jgi:hypothetical protein
MTEDNLAAENEDAEGHHAKIRMGATEAEDAQGHGRFHPAPAEDSPDGPDDTEGHMVRNS